LVAVTFIASHLVAFEPEAPKMSKKSADTVHRVFAAPGVDYFGLVTAADGEHRFVAGAAYPAWCAKKSRFARCSLFDKGRTEYATDGSSESQGNRNEPSWRPRRMAMAINQELSSVVEDRVVKNCREGPSEVEIAFQDGSTMKVKVMESNSPPLREGSQIRRVYEDGTEFVIDCEDGTTLSLQLIEPGNSVSVRDKNGAVEYRG
jgi:hypothetical protein